MKRTLLLIGIGAVMAWGQVNEKIIEEIEEKVDQILHYNFKLDHFNEMRTPFYVPPKKVDVKVKKEAQIRYAFELLSVLNNTARIKVMKYKGSELVKVTRDWYKVGDKVGPCKLAQIKLTEITLKCGDKIVKKRLFNFKFQIKVK
jgi:hypothetical protein